MDDISRAHNIAKNILQQGGSFGQVPAEDKMLMRKVKGIMKKRPGDRPSIGGERFGNQAANIILKANALIEGIPLLEGELYGSMFETQMLSGKQWFGVQR